MPRAALTTSEIEAFRKKATRAATRLFAEHGYDGVTMRAIAEKLGTSPMAPYRYFENKAEIFELVRADAARRFSDAQVKQFNSTTDPAERMSRMRDAYVQFALQHPDQYRVVFELRKDPETSQEAVTAELQPAVLAMVEAARSVIEAGFFSGDPVTVTHLLWAHVHGLVSLRLAGRISEASLQQLLEVTRLPTSRGFLPGLTVSPPVAASPKRKAKVSRSP
jgi:AcrR family transcriptional regulator